MGQFGLWCKTKLGSSGGNQWKMSSLSFIMNKSTANVWKHLHVGRVVGNHKDYVTPSPTGEEDPGPDVDRCASCSNKPTISNAHTNWVMRVHKHTHKKCQKHTQNTRVLHVSETLHHQGNWRHFVPVFSWTVHNIFLDRFMKSIKLIRKWHLQTFSWFVKGTHLMPQQVSLLAL